VTRRSPRLLFALLATATLSCHACKDSTPPDLSKGGPTPTGPSVSVSASPAPSSTIPEPPADVYPLSEDEIARYVNPKGATEYTGPTAAVEGTVKVTGDPPPPIHEFKDVPKECAGSSAVHGLVYRKGEKGELADALVAVIGVSGYVRPSRDDKNITIRNCSVDPAVIDLSIGQRLFVANEDDTPYTPQVATKMIVTRLSIKGNSPAPLMLTHPGAYAMSWLVGALPGAADVPVATIFVLPSALHAATGKDGKFRITGIPVGKARVTASHLGMPEAFKDVELKAGEVQKVELTMTYKKAAPASSASVKPKPVSSIH
jgi:hypothetical protein